MYRLCQDFSLIFSKSLSGKGLRQKSPAPATVSLMVARVYVQSSFLLMVQPAILATLVSLYTLVSGLAEE